MARNWDKLAGEKGREVPSSRLKRLLRVGTLGVTVTTSTVARKVGKRLIPGLGGSDGKLDPYLVAQGEKVMRVLGELKGATMKVGQILSADPELVPAEFVDSLTALQRDAPPMTYRQVKEIIEEAFDRPIEVAFDMFQPEPIGSASIGQVHRATLATGEEVAIKIQYPGIRNSLDSDIRNLQSLLSLGRVLVDRRRLAEYLEEVRQTLIEEADYEAEAAQLAHFHEIFADHERVRVPKPFPEWTRPNVLTMEFVPGEKLDEALAARPVGDERNEILERFVATYSWMLHDLYELHADPHPGNFILDDSGGLVILDFGCVKECDHRFADGVLDILDACWQHDDARAAALYQELGFGKEDADAAIFDPVRMRQYHDIILEPFLHDRVWDFGSWEIRERVQRFILRNPAFIKLVPPAGALLIFRVLSGIKGLLMKVKGQLNIHRMAVEVARRRGRLTAEPLPPRA